MEGKEGVAPVTLSLGVGRRTVEEQEKRRKGREGLERPPSPPAAVGRNASLAV